MNCDEAFDALTDPAAGDNSALKWHLEFCPRCREMREVLAPALAILAVESVESSDEDSSSNRLPELFPDVRTKTSHTGTSQRNRPAPFLTPEAVHIAEQTARTLHPARKRFASPWFWLVAAGAACILVTLGIFLAATSPSASPRHSDPVMLADQCLWTERSTDTNAKPPEDPSARWVVLSCVACHLEQSLE